MVQLLKQINVNVGYLTNGVSWHILLFQTKPENIVGRDIIKTLIRIIRDFFISYVFRFLFKKWKNKCF